MSKEFWDDQAKVHGISDLATAPDHHYRTLEIASILRAIGGMKHDAILDVGCGNGYSTLAIARKFKDAEVTGVDFSEAMIAEANKVVIPNAEFHVGNVLHLARNAALQKSYDVVLSTRCLINLLKWEEQKNGIVEMVEKLGPNGRLVLVENVIDGLKNLNRIRKTFGLHEIEVRWHNRYLQLDEVKEFCARVGLRLEYSENIGNMYYIASRVIYAKQCMDQGIDPVYDSPINSIASQLPTMGEFYACSPNFLLVLRQA